VTVYRHRVLTEPDYAISHGYRVALLMRWIGRNTR